jgi:nitroreductase
MQKRSHVAPKRLIAPGPSADDLQEIFQSAATAPDHGRITPWRFIIIPDHARQALGKAFVAALEQRDPQAHADERQAAHEKAQRSPCLILAVLRAQPEITSPEAAHPPSISLEERLISMGCAIQNMLLTAQAQGWGSGLTSGKALQSAPLRHLFRLTPDEQAICFLNFGTVAQSKPPRQRPLTEHFVNTL